MFNISFWIAALTNNKVSPVQTSKTKSTPGNRSVNPLITANKLGTVLACNTTAANHPNVSAEIAKKLIKKGKDVEKVILQQAAFNCKISYARA